MYPGDRSSGPISLDLYVSGSAVDTDCTGKLVDVWPSGVAQNLAEGILRLRYRNSQEKPELANPGMSITSAWIFGPRAMVSCQGTNCGSRFPVATSCDSNRNLNTGEDQARGAHMVRATSVIYHDKSRPSALILPLCRKRAAQPSLPVDQVPWTKSRRVRRFWMYSRQTLPWDYFMFAR